MSWFSLVVSYGSLVLFFLADRMFRFELMPFSFTSRGQQAFRSRRLAGDLSVSHLRLVDDSSNCRRLVADYSSTNRRRVPTQCDYSPIIGDQCRLGHSFETNLRPTMDLEELDEAFCFLRHFAPKRGRVYRALDPWRAARKRSESRPSNLRAVYDKRK